MRCAICGDAAFISADGTGAVDHSLPGRFGLPELPYSHPAVLVDSREPEPAILPEFRIAARPIIASRTLKVDEKVTDLAEIIADMVSRVSAVEQVGARAVARWHQFGGARVGVDDAGDFVRIEFGRVAQAHVDELVTVVELHPRVAGD